MSVPRRVLVTGAAGMLARAVVPVLRERGWSLVCTDIDLEVRKPWGPDGPVLRPLDVRDVHAVDRALEDLRPDLVLHLAAETSLERCELDPVHAHRTNAEGTMHVAAACVRHDARLVYVSTAGVFDGEKPGAYTEDDEPRPINQYGWTKLLGERVVEAASSTALLLRAGWMMGGPGQKDHKFGGRIVGQLRDDRAVLHVVDDKFGAPTYAPDFAATLAHLVESGIPAGLYHCVSECSRSRAEIAREMVRALDRDDVEIRQVSSEYFAEEFPAPRPRSEVLVNGRLRALGANTMRPWPEPLADYLAPWQAHLGAASPASA